MLPCLRMINMAMPNRIISAKFKADLTTDIFAADTLCYKVTF